MDFPMKYGAFLQIFRSRSCQPRSSADEKSRPGSTAAATGSAGAVGKEGPKKGKAAGAGRGFPMGMGQAFPVGMGQGIFHQLRHRS